MSALPTDHSVERFRAQMPCAGECAYFDHAAIAPLSAPACDAVTAYAADFAAQGVVRSSKWRRRIEDCRRLAATLISADPAEIALVGNTTIGISLIAEGLPWQPKDNVVIPEGEFPSNVAPWQNLASRGVELRIVPTENERLDLSRLESQCDNRTRLVSVSWVGYATGWRNDLRAIADVAHRRGALLFVDAIQGVGALALSVASTPVDFLAADGHKWMLGPEGAGILYIRRAHLDRLRPIGVGWNSMRHAGQFSNAAFDLKETAGRLEGGSYNKAGFAGLAASLELLLEIGAPQIEQRLLAVIDRLATELTNAGAEIASCRETHGGVDRRSGIVAFTLPGRDPDAVRRFCIDRNVILNTRAGRLRASPHAYAVEEDIGRLIDAIREMPN